MSDNIPIDIQREIIKRVPVKSLFQFRSVSKSWKSLIDSSQFIADYNACESRPQRLLIKNHNNPYTGYRYGFGPSYFCIVDDDVFPQHKFRTTVPIINSFEHLEHLGLVGSSQGLFCFLGVFRYDDSYWEKALIWNPAIRKSIAIDVPVFDEMCATDLGFGVCPNTNDPMLVRLNFFEVIDVPFEIFTLSSMNWRRPGSNLARKSNNCAQFYVAIDGFIHWHTFDQIIVSFDMTSEEFVEINLPCSLAYKSSNDLSISKLRESLAVLEHYTDAGKPVCDVWVMEHGVPKSFTKLFTVTTPNASLTKVLGFRKNGEVIFEAETDEDYGGYKPAVLEVFDPCSGHIKDLRIHGENAEMKSVYVRYVPSTANATGIEEFKKFGKIRQDGDAIRTRRWYDSWQTGCHLSTYGITECN